MKRHLPGGIALTAIALTIVAIFVYRGRVSSRVRDHQLVGTQSDLTLVADAIHSLALQAPERASQIWRSNNITAATLYALLSGDEGRIRLLQPRDDWDLRKELVDRWGRPYHVVVGGSQATNH